MPELKDLLEDTVSLTKLQLECKDCGFECTGYIPYGFNPECPNCKSHNTVRY